MNPTPLDTDVKGNLEYGHAAVTTDITSPGYGFQAGKDKEQEEVEKRPDDERASVGSAATTGSALSSVGDFESDDD